MIKIIDVNFNEINGGSAEVIVTKKITIKELMKKIRKNI